MPFGLRSFLDLRHYVCAGPRSWLLMPFLGILFSAKVYEDKGSDLSRRIARAPWEKVSVCSHRMERKL